MLHKVSDSPETNTVLELEETSEDFKQNLIILQWGNWDPEWLYDYLVDPDYSLANLR